jgi:hypothetical protein
MNFKFPLLALILLVSLSFAVAHDEKGKTAATSKESCCMDAKKVSDKASDKCPMDKGTCTMDKASCPMTSGHCDMTKGAKASLKQTGAAKIVKATDSKRKQAKSGVTGNGTN